MEFRKHPERAFRHLLSMPFIYAVIVPLVFLDIIMEIYHRVCFPIYGLPYVKRKAYIKIDRHKLRYLTIMERINCAYCGYANGLMAYAVKIAAETEKYWCAIKHQKSKEFIEPEHHKDFVKYGDERTLEKKFDYQKDL